MKAKQFGFFDRLDGYLGGRYKKCYETHPPLKLGDGIVIYGGSCVYPVVKDADIYVGLDRSMARKPVYPWNDNSNLPIEVYFPVVDGSVPKTVVEFKKMIEWLSVQLIAGKKVHVGCIGGHGRTGLVLSALVKHMLGIEDAITYVRENYCKKAVESPSQVEFLHLHFGIKKVEVADDAYYMAKMPAAYNGASSPLYDDVPKHVLKEPKPKTTMQKKLLPVESVRNIWKKW